MLSFAVSHKGLRSDETLGLEWICIYMINIFCFRTSIMSIKGLLSSLKTYINRDKTSLCPSSGIEKQQANSHYTREKEGKEHIYFH